MYVKQVKNRTPADRGYQSGRILRSYHKDLTYYEVAKRAGADLDTTRRVLQYHGKRCLTMRERIDLLNGQLSGKIREIGVILPVPSEEHDRLRFENTRMKELLSRAEVVKWVEKKNLDRAEAWEQKALDAVEGD